MSPAIAAAGQGRVVIAWTEGPVSNHQVRAQTISGSGAPLGTAMAISDSGVNAGQAQLAILPDGHGIVASLASARRRRPKAAYRGTGDADRVPVKWARQRANPDEDENVTSDARRVMNLGRTILACGALLAAPACMMNGPSRTAQGQPYTSGNPTYDTFFHDVHQQQVDAAGWGDDKKGAHRAFVSAPRS